ncbi:DeoR/GlpR family DNA-binding transcription regulator [Aerococcus tenax]|uniref:DeoR/GlpR family DNA-binding transcription regulator n=1 Tax=Aerococcus tenax TaxID=3078812 RepID=UPI0018A75A6D|nr:DeoR/GlpR family DNA-binding transcription regulator [Aerococcus tenax]
MLKEDRLKKILDKVNSLGNIKVNDVIEDLGVSDMTVRRDLDELESRGLLHRVHGGAISTSQYPYEELSHKDKKIINIEAKRAVAKAALPYIQSGETIFLGPGTTMEILAGLIPDIDIRIVTNCLPVFKKLGKLKQAKLYLIGGEMRTLTESFHGNLANNALESMNFHKAFFSCNAVHDKAIMTATFEEGSSQKIALNNSNEKYLLIDSYKVNKRDFFTYYSLDNIDKVFIDDNNLFATQYIEGITEVTTVSTANET